MRHKAPLLALALAAGCSDRPPGPPPVVTARGSSHADGPGHTHERAKMLLADAGPYHAALTAHLSARDGNELDVFFETAEKDPRPVAVPFDSFSATATRAADGKAFDLMFGPAPEDERPKDEEPGMCSHFVAEAAWLAPDDELTVTTAVEINNRKVTITWVKFNPKKYAHHED